MEDCIRINSVHGIHLKKVACSIPVLQYCPGHLNSIFNKVQRKPMYVISICKPYVGSY